jgi:hypothetical protein
MRKSFEPFEEGDDLMGVEYVRARQYPGVSMYSLGWETEPDEDTVWSGCEVRTGRVLAVMVGDDLRRSFDPDDLEPLERSAFCGECGQVGCTCDGYDREEVTA